MHRPPVDGWVADYNTDRPHQGLDVKLPVTPQDRFASVPPEQRDMVEPWLPPTIAVTNETAGCGL